MLERIGNCRIVDEIAAGGMAVVYRAIQEPLGRTVAVKALKSAVAADERFVIRFEREAQSLAQLQHENIIHVYDFHREQGALFIVMEHVEGVDLYDLLERSGRLPVDVAAIIAMQVARALDYAHYRGIIHRDIKPANVMISRAGGVKLMDFGIARDPAFGDLTETGTGLGTPAYMSPEQILGDKVDYRSDLFSLGIVLYQMCTGRKPFIEDEHRSVMHRIRLEPYPDPRTLNPDVPRELVQIMARCMQKLPRARWRSTQELVLALERFLSRHVEMNYHARLVLYLKNQGVIDNAEAERYLNAANAGPSVHEATTRAAARALVRRVAQVQGAIAGAVALAVGLVHLAPVGASAMPEEALRAITGPLRPSPLGVVRLAVEPWASVTVDGAREPIGTTPINALELTTGKHRLTLSSPYYEPITIDVDVPERARGAPVLITRTLQDRKSVPIPALRLGEPSASIGSPPPPPPVVRHTVRDRDTLELLAAQYYADPRYAAFLRAANRLDGKGNGFKKGDVLTIPTVWTYRAREGDTLAELAVHYLGDARHAQTIATANNLATGAPLELGQAVAIPFAVPYVSPGKEKLADVAVRFYGSEARLPELAAYNQRDVRASLGKNARLMIPATDVRVRQELMPPEDPEIVERARRAREMRVRADQALPEAERAAKEARWLDVRDALIGLEPKDLDGDTAERVHWLLGTAYVGLGENAPAVAEFRKLRERRPGFTAPADSTSPKVWQVLLDVGAHEARRGE